MTDPAAGTRFRLDHRTIYTFDRSVHVAPHEVRLRPAPHVRAPISRYLFTVVEPAAPAHTLHWQQDPYNNWVARVTFPLPTTRLEFAVELEGEFADVNPFDFFVDPSSSTWPFRYETLTERALAPYLAHPQQDGARLATWIEGFRAGVPAGEGTIAVLVRLLARLRADVDYQVREEAGVQSAEETLELAQGSCRDSAWLLAGILRELGFGARFVSGYLVEIATVAGMRDQASMHAWVEAYVPGAGWVGLDPTSGLFAAGGHIPVACAVDPDLAATVTGTHDRAASHLDATITLVRRP